MRLSTREGLLLPAALFALLLLTSSAHAEYPAGEQPAEAQWLDSTDRIIVRYDDDALPGVQATEALTERASRHARIALRHMRSLHGNAHVMWLPRAETLDKVSTIAERLSRAPGVAYAEPDRRMTIQGAPNDPRYNEQWHYHDTVGGIALPDAWPETEGEGVVVAVLDSGVLPHADLEERLLTGYDFVDNTVGGEDPGDWREAGECGWLTPPRDEPSSWHGTHVAGTVAATTDNGLGVAGVAPQADVLPVRVLGKCGGYTSDIVDGMRWAAGLDVTGAPDNPNPAQVLNLSLGGGGFCGRTYENAVQEVRDTGATVVVAAGNSDRDVSGTEPANCPGVVAVAATNRDGERASYSNYGGLVTLSAPGGEIGLNPAGGVLSTHNSGETTPGDDSYTFFQGTSMAAPHVAGVVALLYATDPALEPDTVEAILTASARRFPQVGGNSCTTDECGAGILDAEVAVAAALDGPPYDDGGGDDPGAQLYCGTDSNGNHADADRAWSSWGLYYAEGSEQYIGYGSGSESTLKETAEGYFESVSSCP